ncbi:shieldin complex subunit 2 [Hyla sarda]|uniref:shieldin complex subunit 2 n=1 Tax=Hyla sarda TaxID=327740 RepID=UPI0024C3C218|nr:shieldin complex subunit 2 [Hyla sarda]
MCGRGVIHVFIGAPAITTSLTREKDNTGAESPKMWKVTPFAYNMQDTRIQSGGNHQISADHGPDGGLGENTMHGGLGCDCYGVQEGPNGGTYVQKGDLGEKMHNMDTCDIGIISDLVSSTELCHITHNLQKPLGAESEDHHEYMGNAPHLYYVKSDACCITAETEFLTVLTSSQLAVRSPENYRTEAANDILASISESVKQGVLVENIATRTSSQEGFTCSSDLFTDTSDEELDQKSLRSHQSGKELEQKSIKSQKRCEMPNQNFCNEIAQKSIQSPESGEGLDQKSLQFHTRCEEIEQKTIQSHKSREELDQKSLQSHRTGEEIHQNSSQSHKSEKFLFHIQGDSAEELNNNVDYLGSASSKRKKAISSSSPSPRHEQQSKKSRTSISPVKFTIKRHVKHPEPPPAKSLTLLKHCSDKKKKYDIMAVVLQPCHVKEIKVKSGLNSGSTVPLATIVVIDQSEVKREVLMWRDTAFWSLALLPGEIIVLTNVSVSEDRWKEDIVLQSSFRSKLTNLGSCSSLLSGEDSNFADFLSLKELLDYVHEKHHYLSELSPRQPQRLDHIQFISLAELQPELLLHSLLKVNSISVLNESTYNFKGQQQNKIILIVEQIKGHTSTLVLWGTCVTWCDQICRKRDHIWIFKYLFCKKNIMSGDLELHTTPWSSCECLFDDDQRAIDFCMKYNIPLAKPMSLRMMIDDRHSGEIQVKGSILQIEVHIPGKRKILINHKTLISDILKSLLDIVYTGCEKCKRELTMDVNKVYEQCYMCLPFNQIRAFYRPAQMTIMSEDCSVRVQVPPDILESVFLNIAPSLLPKPFPSSTDVTYGTIVADLCCSLVAQTGESFVFTIRSQFLLDENSIPLEEDFHLLDFHLDL